MTRRDLLKLPAGLAVAPVVAAEAATPYKTATEMMIMEAARKGRHRKGRDLFVGVEYWCGAQCFDTLNDAMLAAGPNDMIYIFRPDGHYDGQRRSLL